MENIQDKIMQVNGIDQNKVPNGQLKGIQVLMKREQRRFKIAKLLTGFFWTMSLIILGLYIIAGKMFRHYQLGGSNSSSEELVTFIVIIETLLPLTIIIAAVCTLFLFIRAKSANLLQVHERLSNLEEMVKVLLSK